MSTKLSLMKRWIDHPHALESDNIRLELLTLNHKDGLTAACKDGELWQLNVTSVPNPEQLEAYIQTAIEMQRTGQRIAFAVWDKHSQRVVGCTSYHDIVPDIQRLEIGYTWYAKSAQRTHVNSACKLLLLTHAFETLGAQVVGWRTDHLNRTSQRAIERLGAKKDGCIRHHKLRKDGTVRDTVMYSMLHQEWPEAKAQLQHRLRELNTFNT